MVVDPVPEADGAELVAGYAADLTRSGWHTNLIHYGFALMAPVAYGIVALVRGRGAWLANVAGLFAIIGLSTLPGLVLLDFTSVAAALATDLDTATAIDTELESLTAFTAVIIPAFLTSVLALPLAVIAAWRARLVPGWLAIFGVVTLVALNAAPTWWLAFGTNAVWMAALAWALSRIPREVWFGSAGGHQAPADDADAQDRHRQYAE
jgi:hypothetical protein